MKKLFILLLALAVVNPGNAQKEQIRVAVCVYGPGDANVRKIIRTDLISLFKNAGYDATDRTSEFLRNMQNVSLINGEQIAAFGRQYETAFVCAVKVTPPSKSGGHTTVLTLKVNTETAQSIDIPNAAAHAQYANDWKIITNDMAAAFMVDEYSECRGKDQPLGNGRCCDGLTPAGYRNQKICRDISGEAYWLLRSSSYFTAMAYDKGPVYWEDAENECPLGWRLPKSDETWAITAGLPGLWGTFDSSHYVWTSDKICDGNEANYGYGWRCEGRYLIRISNLYDGENRAVYLENCEDNELCIETHQAYVRCVRNIDD
jgi:hypothetical protein